MPVTDPPRSRDSHGECYTQNGPVPIDLTRFSEDELIDLNRRIIERLQFIRSAKHLTQLARFSVGMTVEFEREDGSTVRGSIARLNRQTATVVGPSGRWRVSPALLRIVESKEHTSAPRIISMPHVRHRE